MESTRQLVGLSKGAKPLRPRFKGGALSGSP